MRTILPLSVAGAALFLGGMTQAFGQYQQYPQNPNGAYGQYSGPGGSFEGGYDQNGAYGRYDRSGAYGRYDRADGRTRTRRGDLFEAVRMDLEQAASQYSYGGGDDRHFNSALDHLARFREGMIRGEYRKGDLNKAIQQTQEVARGGALPPDLRTALFRDADAMRDYRARMDRQRDQYYYGRRPSYYPY